MRCRPLTPQLQRTARRIPTFRTYLQDNAQISPFSVYNRERASIWKECGFSASWGAQPDSGGPARQGALRRRDLHAYCDHGTVGRHRAAAAGGAFGGDDGGVAASAAIGGHEQFVLAALHRAVGRVAIRSNHPNAERRARRTGIAFRARRAGRPWIALRAGLTLTATHQSSG